MKRRTLVLLGAGMGLAAFLGVALLPSMLYGGYAAVLLAGAIFGAPVEATLTVRAMTVAGMVLGVTSVAALFSAAGGALGLGVSVLAHASAPAPATASESAGADPKR